MSNWVVQICIVIFGVGAIWLANDRREHYRRWAPIAGLLGQPAWIVAAIQSGQMGVLLVSLLYTVAWGRGFWMQWIEPRRSPL